MCGDGLFKSCLNVAGGFGFPPVVDALQPQSAAMTAGLQRGDPLSDECRGCQAVLAVRLDYLFLRAHPEPVRDDSRFGSCDGFDFSHRSVGSGRVCCRDGHRYEKDGCGRIRVTNSKAVVDSISRFIEQLSSENEA